MNEMRLMLSVKELEWFKREFPDIKWLAGDTTIRWNANNPEEVELARKAYEAYKKKHPQALAYRTDRNEKKEANSIKDFDPNAELILMVEPMVGG